jgi:hypothetical protein
VALLQVLAVCPEPCVIGSHKAAVEIAIPAGLLLAEHLEKQRGQCPLLANCVKLLTVKSASPTLRSVMAPSMNGCLMVSTCVRTGDVQAALAHRVASTSSDLCIQHSER